MSEDIRINGMELIAEPKLTQSNNQILAYFSADIGVFSFKGCSLVRTARQGIAAWLPRLDHTSHHNQRRVSLNDEVTRNALLKAAREMYQRMGGTHAEWRPRERDEDQPDTDIPATILKPPPPRPAPQRDDGDTSGVVRFLGADAA